ncbi:MAG: DUF3488 and DUF4129 domain-containing transglutaminase family protein [Methylacidiphilales bacterium]|nr:DUF3488 and DUF4129 domain-containing transglutaminase family protein [Candidatus Methylacidiphilales bacterium]
MPPWSALFLRPVRPAVPTPRPSLTLFFWLVGGFILTLLPQIDVLPIWISMIIVGALAIRAVLEIYRLPLPSTLFTALLALCLLTAIALLFQTLFSREAETAFMAGLMTIKFYELRGPRDVNVIIFSSFFIVMSALLYSQALELFIYCLIMMWLLTATLLRNGMGDRPDNHLLPMLGLAGVVFLQALPLTLFLFFFLPRFTGKLQITLNEAPLGISDRVEPGSVARLANNDSTAMYVRFTAGSIPDPETMYWRGLVLWEYQAGAWTPGKMGANLGDRPVEDPDSTEVTEEITILPHNQRWLFALDYPFTKAYNDEETGLWKESLLLSGWILQLGSTDNPIDHTERYTVQSASQLAPAPSKDPLKLVNRFEYDAATQLPSKDKDDPDHIDPQVTALADRLHAAHPEQEAYVVAVLHYFRHEGFIYTASPGNTPPGRDWLSYFLFTTKAGYCEYFASAFAVLMRLENIPARLVVGYQGAEYNPYKDVYIVRQSDAHAWDEVWIDAKRRWIRIDPTSILPPGLANFASSDSGGAEENQPIRMTSRPLNFAETYLPEWTNHVLNDLDMRREQVEVSWDDWVFSYNPDTQTKLARFLGFGQQALGLVCAAAILLCFLIFRRLMRPRVVNPPIENLYAKFCRSMAQRGIPRAKWEGPLAYTDRVAEAFPEKEEAIHHVGAIVARFRYGPLPVEPATPKELQALLAQIAASQAAASSAHE